MRQSSSLPIIITGLNINTASHKVIKRQRSLKSFKVFSQRDRKVIEPEEKEPVLSETVIPENVKDKIVHALYEKDYHNAFMNIKRQVEDNWNMIPEPKKTLYSSADSTRQFYSKYRLYKHTIRVSSLKDLTPSLAFIKGTHEHKIAPSPMGLINRERDETKVQLTNFRKGNEYMKALGKGLEKAQHNIKELLLKANRLDSIGTNNLFKSLNGNKILLSRIINLDLSSNKLGKDNIEQLIDYFQDKDCRFEKLNISDNNLGDQNIIQIATAIATVSYTYVTSINFAKNKLSDLSIPIINTMVTKCSGLRVLILNWNTIGNKGGTLLINNLKNHSELRQLDISFNGIGTNLNHDVLFEEIVYYDRNTSRNFHNYEINEWLKSMALKFRKNPLLVKEEKSVVPSSRKDADANKKHPPPPKVVRLAPAVKQVSSFAREIGEYFRSPQMTLIHLDISYNNLTYEDCEVISNDVKNNHTILGIHLDGNEAIIDGLGFTTPMRMEKQTSYYAQSQIFYELNNVTKQAKTKIDAVKRIRCKNNCWICEGWREIEFVYIPKPPLDNAAFSIIKLHLNFDEWKPYDLIGDGRRYSIIRMCPPGEIFYFITNDMKPVEQYPSDEQTQLSSHGIIKYYFDDEYMGEYSNLKLMMKYSNTNETNPENKTSVNAIAEEAKSRRNIKVSTVGKKVIDKNNEVITEDFDATLRHCEPRPIKTFNRFIKPRTPWHYDISIWASYGYPYKGDSQSLINNCFEHDFNRCQFEKDFKTPEELSELKEFLRGHYTNILYAYKTMSSYSGCTLWQISQSSLAEFVINSPGLCDKKYDVNNVFIVQTGICANAYDKEERKNGNRNLCDNLVRHQFLALLVKVPRDKYVNILKTIPNYFEAIKYSFENHFKSAIENDGYHQWRIDRYYNEQVDNFLKAHYPILDAVYKSRATQKGPRKKDLWMVLDEFNMFVQALVDTNEYPVRDNPLVFNYSIRLLVSEINSDKHINMFFPEFLEALCRTIDKASPYPPEESVENWSMAKRMEQPLVNKLENVIDKMARMITHPDCKLVKEKFPKPVKDTSTDLYGYDLNSVFYQGLNVRR